MQVKTQKVVYWDENNRQVRYVRFADVRKMYEHGSINCLQVEYLADVTNEMNTISDKEDYPDVSAMLTTIEAGWIVQA